MTDAYDLRRALESVAATLAADYEAAAKSGDVARRYRTSRALDALRQLAGDADVLHMIARELRA